MTRLLTWWRAAGVQMRSTIAATAVQAIVVFAAGLVLLLTLQHNLDTTVDASTSATAQGLAALLDPTDTSTDEPTTETPAGTATTTENGSAVPADLQEAINAAARRRAVVQVIGTSGEVLASSSDLSGYRPLTTTTPGAGVSRALQLSLPFDDDPYRFTALDVHVGSAQLTVLVGESLGIGDSTLHAALVALAVAGPLLLLTVAGATWIFVGHSLRPVTDIRSTVDRITHRDLSERVPVPPGHDEVAQLARTMNTLLGDLQRASATQRQFVSDASHELRSPVATLLAAADIALALPDRQRPGDLPRLVRGEARRLDRLVTDLLLLARLDERSTPSEGPVETAPPHARGAGRELTPQPEDADLDEVDLDDVVTDEARRLRASTALTIHVRREPVRVQGHRHELSRAVRNLTDNAARHAATAVSLRLYREGDRAVLEVANDGEAIAPADVDRVFERFVRLEESRARDLGGSGLGLAIVQEIVRAHRGTVQVVSCPAMDESTDESTDRHTRESDARAGGSEVCFRIKLPLPW